MNTKHKVPFFNAEDIALLQEVGGKKYDKNNDIDKQSGNILNRGVWEKTKYWHSLVKAQLKDLEYLGDCEKKWQIHGKKFLEYTWGRLYKEGDKDYGIYFTVGAGQQGLDYKLDYQHKDSSGIKLNAEQKTLCESLIRNTSDTWIFISADKLHKYTWNDLVDETVAFVIKYTSLYDEAIEAVWNLNQKRIARIAYNTEGWIEPSGNYGKSKSKNSHEFNYGYGHEEWLFDLAKTYQGYHYAFLEPVRKQHQAYEGNIFDVVLYTINGETKQRYFIGEIDNVEVLTEEQAEQVYSHYEEKGWLDEMEQQIINKNINPNGFSNWKGLSLFNIRFRVSDVKLAESLDISIPSDSSINNLNRYSFAHYKEEYALTDETQTDTYNFNAAKDSEPAIGGEVKKRKYERQPKTLEIEDLHQAISDKLLIKLKSEGRTVKREVGAGYANNRIDLVEQLSDGDIFYEIKTYPSLKTSIRVAIGQLLEYSMWTKQNKAKELIVITQPMPDMDKVKEYFAHIRKTYNMPLYYQSFDVDTNELSEKV